MEQIILSPDEKIDQLQVELGGMEQVRCPLVHLFTKGMYTRQIFMPAWTVNAQGEKVQTVVVSKIHKTTHTYNISMGKCAVYNRIDDFLGVIEAPYLGVTLAGTRRILAIVSDIIWTTNHPLEYITGEENSLSEEDMNILLKRIENDLIEEREVSSSVS
jgi:hypothetical protein